MRVAEALLRLPIRFDAAALADEIAALPAESWRPHPNRIPGNEAMFLVTTEGRLIEDLDGPMAPTEYLRAAPYVMRVMAAIGAVWGRCRLMRLSPGAKVPPHVDTNFYWRRHVRIHVPIVTSPEVSFTCRGKTVHMAAGECWVFDTFSNHQVVNGWARPRTHLVMDTVGGEGLWSLIEAARAGAADWSIDPAMLQPTPLVFEGRNNAVIMTPWELDDHVAFVADQARPAPGLDRVVHRLRRFAAAWHGAWAQHQASPAGYPDYCKLIAGIETDLRTLGGEQLRLKNGLVVYHQINEILQTLAAPMLDPPVVQPMPVLVRA